MRYVKQSGSRIGWTQVARSSGSGLEISSGMRTTGVWWLWFKFHVCDLKFSVVSWLTGHYYDIYRGASAFSADSYQQCISMFYYTFNIIVDEIDE